VASMKCSSLYIFKGGEEIFDRLGVLVAGQSQRK